MFGSPWCQICQLGDVDDKLELCLNSNNAHIDQPFIGHQET